jgi:hypothetical protein
MQSFDERLERGVRNLRITTVGVNGYLGEMASDSQVVIHRRCNNNNSNIFIHHAGCGIYGEP